MSARNKDATLRFLRRSYANALVHFHLMWEELNKSESLDRYAYDAGIGRTGRGAFLDGEVTAARLEVYRLEDEITEAGGGKNVD